MPLWKTLLIALWERLGWATWIKITTTKPACTYYFGPFLNQAEAKTYQGAYITDLEEEGANGIAVEMKRGPTPEQLTIEQPESTIGS